MSSCFYSGDASEVADLRKRVRELETENQNLKIHVQKLLKVKENCLKNHDQGDLGDSKEGVRSRSRSPRQRRRRSPESSRATLTKIEEPDAVITLD